MLEALSSPQKSAELAQRAQAYAANQFGWRHFVDFVGGVYDSVLDRRSMPALGVAG
jgi:hypothetical protein